jgi:hypothetical protein
MKDQSKRRQSLKIWEPVKAWQISALAERGIDGRHLPPDMATPPPDPTDLQALSTQEAVFLTGGPNGQTYKRVPPALTLAALRDMGFDAETFPALGSMIGIRDSLLRLGWKRDRYLPFLRNKFGVGALRELDHKKAHKCMIALGNILKERN